MISKPRENDEEENMNYKTESRGNMVSLLKTKNSY